VFVQVFTFHTWWIEKAKRVDMVMDFYPERNLWRCRVDVPLPVQIFRRTTGAYDYRGGLTSHSSKPPTHTGKPRETPSGAPPSRPPCVSVAAR